MLVCGDCAQVELESLATTQSGLRFENKYYWIMRFANNQIVEVHAYLDSALIQKLFDENRLTGCLKNYFHGRCSTPAAKAAIEQMTVIGALKGYAIQNRKSRRVPATFAIETSADLFPSFICVSALSPGTTSPRCC